MALTQRDERQQTVRRISKDQRSIQTGALGYRIVAPSHGQYERSGEADITAGLKLLFYVGGNVIRKFREFVGSGRAGEIKKTILHSLKNGRRIFFTGCGATGRLSILLDSVWGDFWRSYAHGAIVPTKKWREKRQRKLNHGCFKQNSRKRPRRCLSQVNPTARQCAPCSSRIATFPFSRDRRR
jgi:hypothetical protein